MASLGIVIAVSNYTHDANDLPACRRDGDAIAEVLRLSGRFDKILRVDRETKSTNVKQRLAEFIKSYPTIEIDEVFFYFTGHGAFYNNEFYYLLTDYQQRRLRQTSLENTELDNIIRAINPTLFVKIVDACHSGMTYIKSTEEFNEYVKKANTVFKKLYFMFSSRSDQFSYQNNEISYFTESILKAIANYSATTIRYKDVIDFVSDDFAVRDFQTPLFVTQADFTEVFCDVNQQLRSLLTNCIQSETASTPALLTPDKSIVIQRLKEDAKRFCSREEAHKVLNDIVDQIKHKLTGHPEISDLYTIGVATEDDSPPEAKTVGGWIDKNRGEYFAKPNFRHQEIIGFTATTEMPYRYIGISLNPRYPNLTPEECIVVPIVSRTHISLFWRFWHFEYVDWESARPIGEAIWTVAEAELKGAEYIEELTSTIVSKFWEFVEEPLRAKWGPGPAPALPAESKAEEES